MGLFNPANIGNINDAALSASTQMLLLMKLAEDPARWGVDNAKIAKAADQLLGKQYLNLR